MISESETDDVTSVTTGTTSDESTLSGGHTGNDTSTSSGNNNATSTGTTPSGNGTSNSDSTPVPPAHTHTWVHIDATGHYEIVIIQYAWDEEVPVYGNAAHDICNVYGADITNLSETDITNHMYNHMICNENAG